MVVKSVLLFENTAELQNGNGRCKAKNISISQDLTHVAFTILIAEAAQAFKFKYTDT